MASYYRARERSDADHNLPRRWAQSGRQARPVLPNREAGLDCEQRERNSGTYVVKYSIRLQKQFLYENHLTNVTLYLFFSFCSRGAARLLTSASTRGMHVNSMSSQRKALRSARSSTSRSGSTRGATISLQCKFGATLSRRPSW